MSDTTLDCKFQKAGVPGHIGTGGARAEAIASELAKAYLHVETGRTKMLNTRAEVEQGWRAISDILSREGKSHLAAEVGRFVNQLPPPRTGKQLLAANLLQQMRVIQEQNRLELTR